MKSVAIARIELDACHVSGLRYGLEDARLAAALSYHGVGAKLYQGKSDGRVIDLVRQLVRMRVDAYVFHVSKHTYYATEQIVSGVKELKPGAMFIFWGGNDLHSGQLDRARLLGELSNATTMRKMLADLSRMLSLSICINNEWMAPSPYITGLISAEEGFILGLSADQGDAQFLEELQWLDERCPGSDRLIPVTTMTESVQRIESLLRAVAAKSPGQILALRGVESPVTPEFLSIAKSAGVRRIEWRSGPSATGVESDQLGIECVLPESESQRLSKSATYANNGLAALHTGAYFDANQGVGTYHLQVSLELSIERRRAAYSWASKNMAIRSAAVVHGSVAQVADSLSNFSATESNETQGWPKHVYAISREPGESLSSTCIDGDTENKKGIRYVPLRNLGSSPGSQDWRTFVTLHDEEDVDELERRLASLHNEGKISVPHPSRSVLFENTCRWLGAAGCRLPLLRRLEVDRESRIMTCRDSGIVGNVGDSFEQIGLQVRQKQQLKEVRRGCAACPVRDNCSQCVQLPQSWSGRYCDIRKTYVQASLYFELMSFPILVKQFIPDGIDVAELLVSYKSFPTQHYDGRRGTERTGDRPVLVSAFDNHVAWWRGTRKLVKLSKPLATIVEAWWLGAADHDIVNTLRDNFEVDLQTAQQGFEEGIAKLSSAGVIYV